MNKRIIVRWAEDIPMDVLPENLTDGQTVEHSMFSPKTGKKVPCIAKGRVRVSANVYELDYGGEFEAENKANELYIGVTRLTIPKTGSMSVEWKWAREEDFESCDAIAIDETDLTAMCKA